MTKLKIATYNINGCKHGEAVEIIANDIKEENLDIVGLQEIDLLTERSGNIDMLKELSRRTLKHYVFIPAMQYNNGLYGTGILSRFPIVEFEDTLLPSPGVEQRSFGRAEIMLENGFILHFFNTHLSVESGEVRAMQYKILQKRLSGYEDFVLTGDFNAHSFAEYEQLPCGSYINNDKNPLDTEEGKPKTFKCIDNIFIKKNSEIFSLTDAAVRPRSSSDHNMLHAELTINNRI